MFGLSIVVIVYILLSCSLRQLDVVNCKMLLVTVAMVDVILDIRVGEHVCVVKARLERHVLFSTNLYIQYGVNDRCNNDCASNLSHLLL